MLHHSVRSRWKVAGSRTRTRARTRRKGKKKARAKERAMRSPRTRSSKGVAATAESAKLPIVGTEKRNRSTKFKAKLAEMGLVESESEDAEKSWLCLVADSVGINQFSMDSSHSLVVESWAPVHVCPKSYATHATLSALQESWRGLDLRSASGKMLTVWCARICVQHDGSARRSVHCENPPCRL